MYSARVDSQSIEIGELQVQENRRDGEVSSVFIHIDVTSFFKKMYLVLFYVNRCFACMYVLSTNHVSKVRRGTKFLITEAIDGC